VITLTLLEAQTKTPLQQWSFEDATVIRIGRAVDNHVVVANSLVSRYHLELRLVSRNAQGNAWEIISHGTNGTFLNGTLVAKSSLPHNSLLELAQGGPLLEVVTLGHKLKQPQPKSVKPVIASCGHPGNSPHNLFCVRCGQPISVQQTIRQYMMLRTLGQGGMGTTYLAWDPQGVLTGVPQLLVLKQMNADMAKIAKAQELFAREANALKSLSHEGIPKYYDFFVEDGKKYLAMELIHGQDLEKRIYTTGPVAPNQAIAWMIQTCDILEYLHNQEPPLIHRDIKPANLMVRNADNQIVVLDFGAVKETGTLSGTRIGAEGYCAPEQERGQPLTQSDLYAIGPTLIFLLSGENPFKYYRQKGRSFRFDMTSIPTITPQLRDVIDQVTETLPRDRFQTAQELAMALTKLQLSGNL
jgi:serine/threonine-protein kinase